MTPAEFWQGTIVPGLIAMALVCAAGLGPIFVCKLIEKWRADR